MLNAYNCSQMPFKALVYEFWYIESVWDMKSARDRNQDILADDPIHFESL